MEINQNIPKQTSLPSYGEVVETQSEDGLRSMDNNLDSRFVSGKNEEEKRQSSELNLTENDSSKFFHLGISNLVNIIILIPCFRLYF